MYAIDSIPEGDPVVIKLHVTTHKPRELSDQQIKNSLQAFFESLDLGFVRVDAATEAAAGTSHAKNDLIREPQMIFEHFELELKQFPHKNQIKIFLRLTGDRERAKQLFTHLFKAYDLPFINDEGAIKRKMRCYLVLPEERMVQLSEQIHVENQSLSHFNQSSLDGHPVN